MSSTRRSHPPDAPPSGAAAPPEIEQEVQAIWAKVLDVPEVDRDDDFFFLGGDSLDATLIAAHVEDRFGVALPGSTLFEHATPAKLAALVAGSLDS